MFVFLLERRSTPKEKNLSFAHWGNEYTFRDCNCQIVFVFLLKKSLFKKEILCSRGESFKLFCLPSGKRVYRNGKGKNLLHLGEDSFLFEWASFQKGFAVQESKKGSLMVILLVKLVKNLPSMSSPFNRNCETEKKKKLTLTMLWADSANDILKQFFLFFPENRIWHFMQIVS